MQSVLLLFLSVQLGCPKASETTTPAAPAAPAVEAPSEVLADTTPPASPVPVPDLGDGAEPEVLELPPQAVPIEMCSDPDLDAFQVASARLDGDRLLATVRYGGGCAEHGFKVCWDGRVATSLPPQMSLRIIHDSNGDSCRAIKMSTLELDLSETVPSRPMRIMLHDQVLMYE